MHVHIYTYSHVYISIDKSVDREIDSHTDMNLHVGLATDCFTNEPWHSALGLRMSERPWSKKRLELKNP